MSPVEIIIVVLICIVPIAALVIILPKKIAKKTTESKMAKNESKKVKQKTKKRTSPELPTLADMKAQEHKSESPRPVNKTQQEYTSDDFRGYLQDKKDNKAMSITPKKSRIEEKYDEKIERMMSERRPFSIESPANQPKEKTIIDQLDELSPELKALLLSGALDRKKFDGEGE